ncbi:MAG: hypothetical protein IPL28_05545 [Chloroflexi bacterium]|nr:hypothetical protein [Chloroflexota bacterium]
MSIRSPRPTVGFLRWGVKADIYLPAFFCNNWPWSRFRHAGRDFGLHLMS